MHTFHLITQSCFEEIQHTAIAVVFQRPCEDHYSWGATLWKRKQLYCCLECSNQFNSKELYRLLPQRVRGHASCILVSASPSHLHGMHTNNTAGTIHTVQPPVRHDRFGGRNTSFQQPHFTHTEQWSFYAHVLWESCDKRNASATSMSWHTHCSTASLCVHSISQTNFKSWLRFTV